MPPPPPKLPPKFNKPTPTMPSTSRTTSTPPVANAGGASKSAASVPTGKSSPPPSKLGEGIEYYYQINSSESTGFHWTLVANQGGKTWNVTGHSGPNPRTHEGALAGIEWFKGMVANSTVRTQK